MFALTALYTVLFVYIYLQSHKFTKSDSSVHDQPSTHELRGWQANLECNVEHPRPALQTILRTQSVTVITESHEAAVRRIRRIEDNSRRRMTQVAVRLLCYPIVYICLTMPVSIARLAQFAGQNWGLTAIHVGAAIYVCSGWVNVLLYTATRKGIISWNWLVPRNKKSPKSTGHPAFPSNISLKGLHVAERFPNTEKAFEHDSGSAEDFKLESGRPFEHC
jgi:hypothetical protein